MKVSIPYILFDYEDARKEIWVIVKYTKVTLRYFF